MKGKLKAALRTAKKCFLRDVKIDCHKGSEKSRHDQAFEELISVMRTKAALLEQLANVIKEWRSL